jgi:hypothetical protein
MNHAELRSKTIQKRGHHCEICGLSEWMGKVIPLELEYIDGNPFNFSDENLQLVCLNCHSVNMGMRWREEQQKKLKK